MIGEINLHWSKYPFPWAKSPALQGGAPPIIGWFIIPLTIDISWYITINHSYGSYVRQLNATGGTTLCHGTFSKPFSGFHTVLRGEDVCRLKRSRSTARRGTTAGLVGHETRWCHDQRHMVWQCVTGNIAPTSFSFNRSSLKLDGRGWGILFLKGK